MDLPQDFISVLNAVTNKRARFVIDTILEKGYCSTEDLKNGGYEHAPRAARDVRELGIPLETYKIKDSTGKSIAAYRFGDWEEAKKKNQLSLFMTYKICIYVRCVCAFAIYLFYLVSIIG